LRRGDITAPRESHSPQERGVFDASVSRVVMFECGQQALRFTKVACGERGHRLGEGFPGEGGLVGG
jgi:hypothetical protein